MVCSAFVPGLQDTGVQGSVENWPAEVCQPVQSSSFNGGFVGCGYVFLRTSGPSPITARMRFFKFAQSSSGVFHTMWL